MRPCARNWNSCWRKTASTASCSIGIRRIGAFRMPSARRSPKKANPSASCCTMSSPWCSPKPCSNGIASSSPANGISPAAAKPNRDGPLARSRLKSRCSNSPARIQAGVMIASSAPWLIWGGKFPTRPSAIFSSARDWDRPGNANATPLGPSSFAGTRTCSGPPQHERNHQGLDNVIPFPDERTDGQDGTIRKAERLGGLLNFHHRAAA